MVVWVRFKGFDNVVVIGWVGIGFLYVKCVVVKVGCDSDVRIWSVWVEGWSRVGRV